MCGIAGCYGLCDRESINRMVEAQARRGPDDRGVWHDPDVPAAFGHNRLSIIDTTPGGHQPMSYANGRFWITYNGEVYNYLELRKELESHGFGFQSNSDTEVILASYAKWGPDCVKRFRGMFAFALADKCPETGAPRMLLARDRLGIKPLLYFENGREIWFASELKALLATGHVARTIDPDALPEYLATGSVFQPRTIVKGVRALPPGHWMEVTENGRHLVRYWNIHQATETLRTDLGGIGFRDARERLSVLLRDAAHYNMVADVPVGAFLSGGIDSTAVVGFMGQAGGGTIKTFSVGFEDAHGHMDERIYAGIASRHLNCDHREIVVRNDDAPEIFENVVRDIDQPSLDGTNTWIVSRAAGKFVKVALSGLGGDELFAGYPHFDWFVRDGAAFPKGLPIMEEILGRLHQIRPHHRLARWRFASAGPAGRIAMLRRLLADHEFTSAIRPEWQKQARQRLLNQAKTRLVEHADPVQKMSYAEISGYLVSTLLRDSDVMSMAHGLEVRPMLLDHPLVEFAYALPPIHKLGGSENKKVFIRAAEEHLPGPLRNRKKMGFEMPFSGWMAGKLKPRFAQLLETGPAKTIFTAAYRNRVKNMLTHDRPPRPLWAWGILIEWMRENRCGL